MSVTITWDGATATCGKLLNGGKFMWEIHDSSITICVIGVTTVGTSSICAFKAELPEGEKTVFAALVEAHDASELPDQHVPLINVVGNTELEAYDLTYRFHGWDWSIPANSQGDDTVHIYENLDIVMPYPILALGGFVVASPAMIGDEVAFIVNPGGVVGYLTETASQGDTHFHVDMTAATNYIWRGYNVGVMDAEYDLFECGECVLKAGDRIDFQTPLDKSYPAYSPVQCEFRLIPKWYRFDTEQRVTVDGGTRWAKIGQNITCSLFYRNVTKTAKRFTFTWKYYI